MEMGFSKEYRVLMDRLSLCMRNFWYCRAGNNHARWMMLLFRLVKSVLSWIFYFIFLGSTSHLLESETLPPFRLLSTP